MKLALYSEYIGSQRHHSNRELRAVAETEEAMQAAFDALYRPGLLWRLEDWETGETLQTI